MNGLIHISIGGPEFDIQVDGKRYHFEMHQYCGPNVLNRDGGVKSTQPARFLYAASQWAQQGRRVEDGLCRWDHEPEKILRHIVGRHYEILGYHPAKKGE